MQSSTGRFMLIPTYIHFGDSMYGVALISATLIKKKRKFSSYIRKFRGIRCKVIYDYNDLLIYGKNICAFPHILGSPSSYSGRTKYSAFVSKLSKLSGEYLCPQRTQKAAVFFYSKDLRLESELNFNRCKNTLKIIA
jgi:hypothetical protein